MNKNRIISNIRIFGVYFFIVLSILEIINMSLIFTTNIELDSISMPFIFVILNFEYFSLFGLIAWIFLICIISTFVILAFFLYKTINNQKLEDYLFSKYLFILGVIILMMGLIKLEVVFFINESLINYDSTQITIGAAFKDFNFMPIYIAYMWNSFTMFSCYYILLGLVIPGVNMNWMLKIQREIFPET
ncbi:MAG: hypothetical protein GF317_09270 [Candidatus Lokiarchaeota archaeon]|nr:hypothetical protein [Candidatus Lokiarchaeota archaeon]MBD3199901.1 hypothetical protein [Candidatus Lokiarchaeota archaeon]